VEADIPPGEQMKPHFRAALVPLVHRMCELEKAYEASARIGAGQLTFRQRWAVLSAAGIYGAIARKVDAAGSQAWDHRVVTSDLAKLGHVLHALWEAATPPPKSQIHPRWSRRELMELARVS
ncbi:MAG: squalene/phytoene synthase family protein, partial [Novosphingobium sp.]